MTRSVAILVPAYNPPTGFNRLVLKLQSINPEAPVIVVDDGSAPELDSKLLQDQRIIVLRHLENQGKGAALKTGFEYIARNLGEVQSVVTVDADGQHLIEDVEKVMSSAATCPGKLVLGVRDFSTDVPLRSSLGNTVTRKIFRQMTGEAIRDTQTGLRAYPIAFAAKCCRISSDRYDFEMRSMILAIEVGVDIEQVTITTLYEEGNKSSHFRPLIDSMRVMAIFLRFLAVSVSSFVIDIAAFYVLFSMTGSVISSTYIARSLSATVNFSANKLFVFKSNSRKRTIYEVAGYISLALLIASLSAFLVNSLAGVTSANVVAIKVCVDCLLFIFSFLAQKHLLFFAADRVKDPGPT